MTMTMTKTMTVTVTERWAWALGALLLCGMAGGAMGGPASDNPVEPSDLERRGDLIGQAVMVDDRVKFYVTRGGTEDDRLELKRTSVPFLVPRRLRPPAHSRMTAVVVRGVLKREEGRLTCDVTSLQIVPNDMDRLERGLASLGPRDYETRKAWARWAERRAAEFDDKALMARARALDADVLRMEGALKRVAVDAPGEWLEMARDARRRKVPEPEPSALAHRALRAKLKQSAADDAAGLQALVRDIESFFPGVESDQASARVNLAPWVEAYANDPTSAYRSAPAGARKALDRRLWADAQEQALDREPVPDLPTGLALADRAAGLLPEKPELPARLREKAVAGPRRGLGGLRLDEVKALAQAYRETLRQPDEAEKVLRGWLDSKRARLSETDAEGPVSLANLYEELLQDRVTAVELLRKSWKIDPTAKETDEAFRLRGFRKIKGEWVESLPAAAAAAGAGGSAGPPVPTPSAATVARGLLGLTPDEVRLKMNGRPTRVSYAASNGQLIEQWIYHLDNHSTRYVNLLHAPGESRSRVVADYTMPRTVPKGGAGSAR